MRTWRSRRQWPVPSWTFLKHEQVIAYSCDGTPATYYALYLLQSLLAFMLEFSIYFIYYAFAANCLS